MQALRLANLTLTGFGVLIFGLALAYVQLTPADFETRITRLAAHETAERLQEEAATWPAALAGPAERLLEASGDDAAELVTNILREACRVDCNETEEGTGLAAAAASLFGQAREAFADMVLVRYDESMAEARREMTIFSGSNLVLCGLALLLGLINSRAAPHLTLVSTLLLITIFTMLCWYLLGQDWLMTLIYGDFWGYAYAVLAGILFAFLIDIAFLHGAITGSIINGLTEAIGSGISISPC